jgi:hypothetical protein
MKARNQTVHILATLSLSRHARLAVLTLPSWPHRSLETAGLWSFIFYVFR